MRGNVPGGATLFVLGILLTLSATGSGISSEPGQRTSRFGTNGYVEYVPGSMPLIITIPHGGTLEPGELPDRISGTLSRYDTNTLELGRAIAAALFRQTGRSPYLVITHVHRKKLDTNREVFEAAQGDSLASLAWEEFHAFIREAKAEVVRHFGSGLLADLHGHRHTRPWVELGYVLSAAQASLPDDSLNTPDVVAASSIASLARMPGNSMAGLLRGPMSLGALLEEEGYEAVPSPRNPFPRQDHYFAGGYNTEQHGSHDAGPIVAIQVETPWRTVRDTEIHRQKFADAASIALVRFLDIHFGSYGE